MATASRELIARKVATNELRRSSACLAKQRQMALVQVVDPDSQKREDLLFVIHEACYSLFYMSGNEHPSLVPETIVLACAYLEMICPNGVYNYKRPTALHVAAACAYLSVQFLSDHIPLMRTELVLLAFRRCDSTVTMKALVNAKDWVLQKLGYGVWITETLFEKDSDIENRDLIEIGFIAENSFNPHSMRTMTLCDPAVLEQYVAENNAYKDMRARLRAFCRNPQAFRWAHFRWSIK